MTDTLSDTNVNLFTLETFAASHFKAAKKAKGNAKKLGKVKVLLQWQKGSLKSGLLTNAPKDAAKLFAQIQAYMGDGKSKELDAMTHAVNILDRTIKDVSPDLRDELYCQLVKQLTCNPSAESTYKGWNLMSFFVQYFPPSQNLVEPVKKFFQVFLEMDDDEKLPDFAKFCLRWLPKTYELGSRGRVPTLAELKDQLDAPFKAAVFGVSLEEVMEAQHELDPHSTLPLVLTTLCDRVVELDGYQTEGIFRVPGDVAQLTALKIQIEHGDYSCQGLVDAHVPGSLLKLWMRELAKPIIPTALYDDAIVSAKADDWEKSVILAEKLEDLNRRVALYVVKYLRDMAVPENVPVTKMSTTNLAMVFAPNFLRCPSEDPSVIFSTQKHQQTFVKHLIEHWAPPDLASVGKRKGKKEKSKGKEREKGNRTHRKEKEEKEKEKEEKELVEGAVGDTAVEVAVENGVHKKKSHHKSARRTKSRSSRGNKTGLVKKQELAPSAAGERRKSHRKHKKRRKSHHAKKEDKSESSEGVQPEELQAVEEHEEEEVSDNTSEEVDGSQGNAKDEKEEDPSVESSSNASDDQVEEEGAIVVPENESDSEVSDEEEKPEEEEDEEEEEESEKEERNESDSAGEEATGEDSGSSVETEGENSALVEEEEKEEEEGEQEDEEEELATTDDGVSSSSGYQDIPSEAPGDSSEAAESSDKDSSSEQSAMSSTQSDFEDEESSSFQ